jgi:3-phosphoglycerate kinase
MNGSLSRVEDAELEGNKVIVRADLEWEGENSPREAATREIIKYLTDHRVAKIKVIGHKGRLEMAGIEVDNDVRRDEREKANDEAYARELMADFDIYINESFAESHRKYTSVNALPVLMKKEGRKVYLGLRFEEEMRMLDQVWQHPGWKILVIGGAKARDKADYAIKLSGRLDRVLVGGLLPLQITAERAFVPSNIILAKLREDQKDITDESIADFSEQVKAARVIICAGPMGKFEEADAGKGTQQVLEAIANSAAYKLVGGGNTQEALGKFGLLEKFDWISVGGGAMLEFLVSGTLPGIEAVIN